MKINYTLIREQLQTKLSENKLTALDLLLGVNYFSMLTFQYKNEFLNGYQDVH